ncbi:hypothetical protein [Methylorubrum extorquens]
MERQGRLPCPYLLFMSRQDTNLRCAIRQDQIVPGFLDGETWLFSGVVAEPAQAPMDLNLKAAQASAAIAGYHLFVALQS